MTDKPWVWPFFAWGEGGAFAAVCPSDVDETQLRYEEGMTLADVKQAALEALTRIHGEHDEWALDQAENIKGAWVIPDVINGKPFWHLIGDMMNTPTWSDSGSDTLLEATYRMVRFLSTKTIDA